MDRIKVLIADDEILALKRIKNLLKNDKAFILVGTCTNGSEVINFLARHTVDLLLLDIEMPVLSGMEVLQHLDGKEKPIIVFVTAYDDFAINAFEYYALDYILKPFSNDRFQKMLERIKSQINRTSKNESKWRHLQDSLEQKTLPEHITVKTGKKYNIIRLSQIAYVSADGNYCNIFLLNGEKFVHRTSISYMAEMLPSEKFIRIHQSSIVASNAIRQIQKLRFSEIELIMKDGKTLKVSRRYKHKIEHLLRY